MLSFPVVHGHANPITQYQIPLIEHPLASPTDKTHLDREHSILVFKLETLKQFANATNVYVPTFTRAGLCRTIQNECELIEVELLKRGLAERAVARLEFDSQAVGLSMRSSWARDHGISVDRILQMKMTEPAVELGSGNSLKCCEPDCIHYIYGFSTIQSLQDHLLQQHAQQSSTIQNMEDRTLTLSQSTNIFDRSSELTGTTTGEDLQCIQFDPTRSKRRKQAMPLPRAKRSRATEDDKLNMIAVREVGSCLRCRVLKKRCGSREPCNHCPQQDSKAGPDFWKSLGCQRTMSDLPSIFLPAHLMTSDRKYRNQRGKIVNLHLQKKALDDGCLYWRQLECVAHIKKHNRHFRQLRDLCWEKKSADFLLIRQVGLVDGEKVFKIDDEGLDDNDEVSNFDVEDDSNSDDNSDRDEYDDSIYGYDLSAYFHPAWILLRVTMLGGEKYFCETAYNPFTLLRLSNIMEKRHWLQPVGCIGQATWVLTTVATSYENEQRSRAFLAENDPDGDVEIETIQSSLQDALDEGIPEIEELLSGRARLTAYEWIGLFYTLCHMSIEKSILVDTWDLRAGYEWQGPFQSSDAVRTCSAYKAWIGIFAWSSRCDYLLINWDGEESNTSGVSANVRQMFRETQKMVHQEKWEERGIKSSKDFLMGLGTGFFRDGSYNGFFFQKYRLD